MIIYLYLFFRQILAVVQLLSQTIINKFINVIITTYRLDQASSNRYKATYQKCLLKIDKGEYRIIRNRHSPLQTTNKNKNWFEEVKMFHLECFYLTEHVSGVKHLLDLEKYILP